MDCACRLIDFKDCQMAEVNWNCRRCRRGPGIKSADYNTQKEKSSHPVSSSLIVIVVAVSRLAQRFGLNLIETQKGIKSAKIIKINKKKIKKNQKGHTCDCPLQNSEVPYRLSGTISRKVWLT